jgi:hypothetical protein
MFVQDVILAMRNGPELMLQGRLSRRARQKRKLSPLKCEIPGMAPSRHLRAGVKARQKRATRGESRDVGPEFESAERIPAARRRHRELPLAGSNNKYMPRPVGPAASIRTLYIDGPCNNVSQMFQGQYLGGLMTHHAYKYEPLIQVTSPTMTNFYKIGGFIRGFH